MSDTAASSGVLQEAWLVEEHRARVPSLGGTNCQNVSNPNSNFQGYRGLSGPVLSQFHMHSRTRHSFRADKVSLFGIVILNQSFPDEAMVSD